MIPITNIIPTSICSKSFKTNICSITPWVHFTLAEEAPKESSETHENDGVDVDERFPFLFFSDWRHQFLLVTCLLLRHVGEGGRFVATKHLEEALPGRHFSRFWKRKTFTMTLMKYGNVNKFINKAIEYLFKEDIWRAQVHKIINVKLVRERTYRYTHVISFILSLSLSLSLFHTHTHTQTHTHTHKYTNTQTDRQTYTHTTHIHTHTYTHTHSHTYIHTHIHTHTHSHTHTNTHTHKHTHTHTHTHTLTHTHTHTHTHSHTYTHTTHTHIHTHTLTHTHTERERGGERERERERCRQIYRYRYVCRCCQNKPSLFSSFHWC